LAGAAGGGDVGLPGPGPAALSCGREGGLSAHGRTAAALRRRDGSPGPGVFHARPRAERAAPRARQVCEKAEAKQAELNAQILRLESQLHWAQQEGAKLQQELKAAREAAAGGGSGGAAAAEAAARELRERLAAMEAELRKSKRAEQKLQVRQRGLAGDAWPDMTYEA
jgi:hypothetical protein